MAAGESLASLPARGTLPLLLRTTWRDCRWPALALLAVQFLIGLTPAAQVAWTARLLNTVLTLPRAELAAALPAAAGLVAVVVLRSVLHFVSSFVQRRLGLDLRLALDGRTLAVSAQAPLALFDRSDWYDLLQAAGTSAGAAAEQVLEQVAWLLQFGTALVAVGALLAAADWWLPLALLAGLVPSAVWELWRADRERRQTLARAPEQRLVTYLRSLLAGDAGEGEAAEVRVYGLAEHLLARWRASVGRLTEGQVGFEARQAAVQLPVQMLRSALSLGALVVLGLAVWHGRIATGTFMALVGALVSFNGSVANVAAAARRIRVRMNALADFARLAVAAELPPGGLSGGAAAGGRPGAPRAPGPWTPGRPPVPSPGVAPEVPSPPSACPAGAFPRPLRCGITFEHVTFSYPGATRPTLLGLDLTLRAGECLALVGPNGAGKSTVVKLLLGLYAPARGRLLADGLDMGSLSPEARAAALAPVFQDHLRWQMTVAEAIGFGCLRAFLHGDPDRVRLQRAARAAGAAGFVEALPLGYATPLGRALHEGGVDLSGGQWQRLAIARALYAEPEVLILDEPAAALDPHAEVDLYARFAGLAAAGRTALLVTHRLGAARVADRVAVLEGGRIVEEGTHAELVEAAGPYARMWQAQARWYQ